MKHYQIKVTPTINALLRITGNRIIATTNEMFSQNECIVDCETFERIVENVSVTVTKVFKKESNI